MSATEQREAPKAARAAEERPRHRTAWIIVAIIGALGIVAPFTFSFVAQSVSRTDPYESPDNGRPHAVSAVEVDAGSAEITVTTGAAGQVTMNGSVTWAMKRPKIERTWDGDTLKVHARCDGFVDEFLQNCQVDLKLAVPAGVSLKVKSGSGPIKVSDLTGPVDLQGGSGSMKLRGLKGTVKAKVGSGEIQASQLSSSEADLKAGSGTVNADFIVAPRRVKARAGSGSVSVTVPEGALYRVEGGKGSGSRSVQKELRDDGSDRVLDVSSGSGSVTVGYPGF
ncbi:DUF4097 family beta strand repeat-containing protein [Streptomyces sp. HUAS TT7]|uniref:DUF4097 family beta strand repeat-containing protein n=1 Tax=Streptomyces sp. HUAS TT7 TaxID=3447507 RepID=UPI003F65B147